MSNRLAALILTFAIPLATLGNVMLLTGCAASDAAVRREARWMYATTGADTALTIHALDNGAREGNPVLAPLSKEPALMAVAMLGIAAYFEWQAARMKAQGNPYWHWPMRAKTIVHGLAVTWNGYQIAKHSQ